MDETKEITVYLINLHIKSHKPHVQKETKE